MTNIILDACYQSRMELEKQTSGEDLGYHFSNFFLLNTTSSLGSFSNETDITIHNFIILILTSYW